MSVGMRAAFLAATALAGTIERLSFSRAWGESASLTSAFYYGDAPRFVEYAKAILQGRSFDNGIPFHPPGWPLLLAAILQLSGAAHGSDVVIPVTTVKIVIAVLSGAAVAMSALMAYEVAGLGAMIAAAFLGTFHFGHIVQGAVANSEALYSLCVMTTVWLSWRWLHAMGGRDSGWAAAAGAVSGCAMLVRAEFLAGAIVVFLVAWLAKANRAPLVAYPLFVCAVLAPSTIWHWRTLSAFNAAHVGRVAGPLPTFAPVTSYGPFNFAMANHPDSDGGPNRDHPMLDRCNEETGSRLSAGELDLQCPAVYELYVSGYAIGLRWILEHPGDALALAVRKVGTMLESFSYGYLIDDVGAGVDGTRRRVDMLAPSSAWLLPVHLLLMIAGAVTLRALALRLLAAPLVALVASTVMFYGYVRLGVAYFPVVWIFEGAAVAAIVARFGRRRVVSKESIVMALAALAVLTAIDAVRSGTTRAVVLTGPRTAGGVIIQDETIEMRRTR
jgi:hypothetical protein